MTPVFLTIDTEYAWRHHLATRSAAEIHQRSIEPAGVGLAYQLGQLAAHGLKACFFVDPMPALAYGLAPIRRIVDQVLDAGQEVQLHLHPSWTAADPAAARFLLSDYRAVEQRSLIEAAYALLVAAGAPPPVAFRAGSFGADDETLAAAADLGLTYDSSFNGADPACAALGLPSRQIAPVRHRGMIEVPVTTIEEAPGRLRPFQLCALSTGETREALAHALAHRHAAVTIVSHSFELATRGGTAVNAVHVRRFDALCAMLADTRDALPTCHFRDRPALPLGQDDAPLAPDRLRTRWRQAEQLWSNWVAERAA